MTFKDFYNNIEEQYILESLIKITGPALKYVPDDVKVSGPVGTHHFMLWPRLTKALAKKKNISEDEAEQLIGKAQMGRDVIEGFMTTDKEKDFVNREEGWNIAKQYKKNVKYMDASRLGSKGSKLASEYL